MQAVEHITPNYSMKRYLLLLPALGCALFLSSCETYGPGYSGVSVGVGYYDTLPYGWSQPYYRYNNRYYYGGSWQTGRYLYGGRYYDGRYFHNGRYYYGGNYNPHHGHGHGPGHGPLPPPVRPARPRPPLIF